MTVVSLAVAILAVIFVLGGWFGRVWLLETNPCKMTYTTMVKAPIKVNSSIVGPRLFKHPSGVSSQDAQQLNPQPVLFIPGNRGT